VPDEPVEPPKPLEPLIESSTFHYDSGAVYEGEFTMMYESGDFFVPPPEKDENEPPDDPKAKGKKDDKKGKKGKEEPEEPEEPLKPPFRVRHGKGLFQDGNVQYVGDFFQDHFHGVGKFTFGSGATYEGQWEKGVFHGKGKYTWADGTFYEGEFVNNEYPPTHINPNPTCN